MSDPRRNVRPEGTGTGTGAPRSARRRRSARYVLCLWTVAAVVGATGCGVALQDSPERLDPGTVPPAPTPTLGAQRDAGPPSVPPDATGVPPRN